MRDILDALGLGAVVDGASDGEWQRCTGGDLVSMNPSNGQPIATVREAGPAERDAVLASAAEAFLTWRLVPAPRRGEIVRQLGEELRRYKAPLGALISLEMGKIRAEGEGEVQEMIDVCDFAVGLSRQLYGLSMHSERPGHRMVEQWHPLGVVGVISAFNFPMAVWSWNAAIAAVCGDTVVWKPSSATPLCAVAVQHVCNRVMQRNGLRGIFNVLCGRGSVVGEALCQDARVPLVSFTGSTEMGRRVNETVARRFGRTILELGGNNALVVLADADLDLALRAVLFGAVGTAGQRCTTTRRVLVDRAVAAAFAERLVKAYGQVRIGDPLAEGTLMGPLVNPQAIADMQAALEAVRAQGGEILYGGRVLPGPGYFVEPCIVRARSDMPIVRQETFAPILYVIEVDGVDDAIAQNNAVPQGLSSALFSTNLLATEAWLSHRGSDCGIANVNVGTSGAEIGGAFGGEKETGGGRESGSDSWKQYMRRQTCTINWSRDLPLAQGIRFGD